MKPATPLPWPGLLREPTLSDQDAAYITHSANAYPQLVQALRGIVEQVECMNAQGAFGADYDTARALLRQLGEA